MLVQYIYSLFPRTPWVGLGLSGYHPVTPHKPESPGWHPSAPVLPPLPYGNPGQWENNRCNYRIIPNTLCTSSCAFVRDTMVHIRLCPRLESQLILTCTLPPLTVHAATLTNSLQHVRQSIIHTCDSLQFCDIVNLRGFCQKLTDCLLSGHGPKWLHGCRTSVAWQLTEREETG